MGNTILKNVSYLFISHVLLRGITAFATILVARYLGVEDYGRLSVAISFSMVAGYFTDLGLNQTLIREGTKTSANLNGLVATSLRIRLLLAFFTSLVSISLIYSIYDEQVLRELTYWIVIPTIWGGTFQSLGQAFFQIKQQMQYTALIRFISGTITASTIFLAIFFQWSLELFGPIYGMSSLIGGFISLRLISTRISILKGKEKAVLNGLVSFTIGGFIVMLIPQLGPLILERVTSISEVGFFSAAYRIPLLLYQIPGIIAAAFYPALFKAWETNKKSHMDLSIKELKYMSALGFLLSLPFLFYPDWIIALLFGDDWVKGSSRLLRILSIITFMQCINFSLADSLTTKGMQLKRAYILSGALLAGVGLYSLFGSLFGALGGAVSAICVEFILMIGFCMANPVGIRILFNGLKLSFSIFVLTIITSYATSCFFHPLTGIIITVSLFILLFVMFDFQTRVKIKKIYKRLEGFKNL